MAELLACLDVGTTRSKAALIDAEGSVRAEASRPAPPLTSWRGFQAFDAGACFDGVWNVLKEAVAARKDAAVRGLIVTGQRATLVPVGADGNAVTPALSWQDTSGDATLAEFLDTFGRARFSGRTGLPPSVLWSLAKILRLRREVPEAFAATRKVLLLHDYVLHRFGASDVLTDPSNASVTGLMDLRTRQWDGELLAAADVPEDILPGIVPAATLCGKMDRARAVALGLEERIPLMVGGGDQQCSTLGMGAAEEGEAGLCLGTAAILSCPVARPLAEAAGSFFCTAHVLENRWVLEGIHNTFGGSLEWAGQVLGLPTAEDRNEAIRTVPPGSNGVMFLPFLAGIGSPDYDARCAGTFLGLRATHGAAELMRAVYEGILLETRRMLDAVPSSVRIQHLYVGGGFTSGATGQLLADTLNRSIDVTTTSETSLLGAAVLGWYGLGLDSDPAALLKRMVQGQASRVVPRDAEPYTELFERYLAGVDSARSLYGHGV